MYVYTHTHTHTCIPKKLLVIGVHFDACQIRPIPRRLEKHLHIPV